MADLAFACDCNTLRGTLRGATASNGCRVECYCHDCRAAEVFAGQPDPAPGAVQLYQTVPFRIAIEAGAVQLSPFSFSDTGPLRWQARCCGSTMFLTHRNPRLSFTSMRTDRLATPEALGPVQARAFVRKENGKRGHIGLLRFVAGFIWRTASARLSGRWKQTPFFTPDGAPVADIYQVSKAERAGLKLG